MKKFIQIITDSKVLGELNTICAVKGITQAQALKLITNIATKKLNRDIKLFEANIKFQQAQHRRFYEAQSKFGGKNYRRKARKIEAR